MDKDVTRSNVIPNHAYKGSLRGENGGELGWIRATIVNQNEIFLYMFDYRKGALKIFKNLFIFGRFLDLSTIKYIYITCQSYIYL